MKCLICDRPLKFAKQSECECGDAMRAAHGIPPGEAVILCLTAEMLHGSILRMTCNHDFRMNDALWRGVSSCFAQVAKRPYRVFTGRIAG